MTLKRKIIVSTVFFLILSILLIVFVVSPLFSEIKKISLNFPAQKQNLATFKKEVENLQKFKKIWPETSLDLKKINQLFIDDPKVPIDFRHFWEKTAQDSGVYLKMSPANLSQTADTDPWPSIVFNFTSVGSFSNLLNFLEKLQSSDYLIEIQDFNITRLTEAELRSPEFKQFSLGDTRAVILIKVYTK
ncbi:MAG TPA: hypothetical protein VMV66_01970 [Candidatus Humimicrobiaceae bacterium]|nr:hypothetical protein [Candidatus Humimicrobiaceae bacterium]